ncbi:tyrosine-type recombinase/integrase [Thalassobaculum sp.]|uniref:tyrosine-type recombinase/integrase n=1 Tax=Thalassobaculum sp. TaxID=2022740 RepID=UPI0032ED0A40
MPKHHPENERIKHRYMTFLREAKRQSEASIDKAMAAIAAFEGYTSGKPFKRFHINQATGFKAQLTRQKARRSGKPLSAATMHATLSAMKAFIVWLADQSGYKSAVSYSDAEYFNISEKERAVATAEREQPVPTLEQIRHAIGAMPTGAELQRRDRAVVPFALLSGARDGAIASLKLKHVDLGRRTVLQDAREVRTKFSKTFTSSFFPVGDDVREIVEGWIAYLRIEKMWGDDDPLFPATKVAVGASRKFEAAGLHRKHWGSATPIRTIFREAFNRIGQPYFNPHSFRKTLAQLGERVCRTPEQMKAWSQNLGHEQVLTTFTSYGAVDRYRQAEIMQLLAEPAEDRDAVIDEVVKTLAKLQRA